MAGGSTDREGDDDRQCVHCGLWFDRLGLHEHEASCRLRDYDRRLVDLVDSHAVMRADDVDLGDVEGDDEAEDLTVGIAGDELSPDDLGEPELRESEPSTDSARTDGGPQAVPSGWDGAGSDPTPDVDDSDDEAACPACGSADWFDPDDLVDRYGADLPDDLVDELREADRVCADCSTTDEGRLAKTVEVYHV